MYDQAFQPRAVGIADKADVDVTVARQKRVHLGDVRAQIGCIPSDRDIILVEYRVDLAGNCRGCAAAQIAARERGKPAECLDRQVDGAVDLNAFAACVDLAGRIGFQPRTAQGEFRDVERRTFGGGKAQGAGHFIAKGIRLTRIVQRNTGGGEVKVCGHLTRVSSRAGLNDAAARQGKLINAQARPLQPLDGEIGGPVV